MLLLLKLIGLLPLLPLPMLLLPLPPLLAPGLPAWAEAVTARLRPITNRVMMKRFMVVSPFFLPRRGIRNFGWGLPAPFCLPLSLTPSCSGLLAGCDRKRE